MRLGYLIVAGSILLYGFPALTIANRSTPVSFASNYRQDAKGLEAEYQPFVNAFNKGQALPFDKEFATLTLPDPAGWFGQYFETEHVQALVDDYEAEVAAEQKSLFTVMKKIWPSGTHFKVHCKPHPPSPAGFPPRQDAYEPKKAVPVEQFDVEFEADRLGTNGGRSMSSLHGVGRRRIPIPRRGRLSILVHARHSSAQKTEIAWLNGALSLTRAVVLGYLFCFPYQRRSVIG